MLNPQDYSFIWWKNGYHNDKQNLCLLTGYFGLQMDVVTGAARISKANVPKEQAFRNGNALLNGLDGFQLSFLGGDDKGWHTDTAMAEKPSRLIEIGKYFQRWDLPLMQTEKGRLRAELTAGFRQLAVHLEGLTPEFQVGFCVIER